MSGCRELHVLASAMPCTPESIRRGRPFGEPGWIQRAAKQLGLEASLRPLGRPRKQPAEGGRFDGEEPK